MFPVLHVGPLAIPTYGAFVAAGWIVGIVWWLRQLRHMKFRGGERELWRLVYLLVGGAVVGGKLLALVDYRRAGLDAILANLSSGFVYFGGIAGACLGGFIFCKVSGYRFLDKFDFLVAGGALGHAVGRVGCFLAGCCHGSPTSLPWGVRFTDANSPVPRELLGVPLHPTPLYEAAGELGIFFLLHFYFQRRRIAGTLAPGATAMARLAMYGALRFLVDFGRGDDPDFRIGPLTVSQCISLVLIVASLWYAHRLHRGPRVEEPRAAVRAVRRPGYSHR
jgi:phosphatidylglycerol---prolipoprotein diacylglyceryl transferase